MFSTEEYRHLSSDQQPLGPLNGTIPGYLQIWNAKTVPLVCECTSLSQFMGHIYCRAAVWSPGGAMGLRKMGENEIQENVKITKYNEN